MNESWGTWALQVLASVLVLPAPAWAQAISGLVRDASVGVLPDVTVEAASPALIEKVRTVQAVVAVPTKRGDYYDDIRT